MFFSLILTTVGRVDDLRRFFRSLASQTHPNFEVLVIDHKPNPVVGEIINEFRQHMDIQYLGSALGHSKGLNMGLAISRGDVVAFPDDDCWYPDDLLETVTTEFGRHADWDGITGRVITEDGRPSNGRWDWQSGFVNRSNAWKRAITVSLFFKRSALNGRRFDETLGVGAGTIWGAGEETDYLLHMVEDGSVLFYDPRIAVRHPEMTDGVFSPAICRKARSYARGMGRVLRDHHYSLSSVGYHVARPVLGAALALLAGRFRKAHFHWSIASGRTAGYLDGRPFSREKRRSSPPAVHGLKQKSTAPPLAADNETFTYQHMATESTEKLSDSSNIGTRFSLLLATVGRTSEVRHFLNSIEAQSYRNFEVLVIDQNGDDRLVELLAEFQSKFSLRHLRCGVGLSKARNAGLKHATGDIIAMPDDDCWYGNNVLLTVASLFHQHRDWDGVTGRSVTQTGETSAGRWDQLGGPLNRRNIWRRAISYTIFLRRSTALESAGPEGIFNETLGVGSGTSWGAGEETELLLRVIAAGAQISYDPALTVVHPQWHTVPYTDTARFKARSYGRGMGRVLRMHQFPMHEVGYHLARPFVGALLALMIARARKAAFHWAIFQGRTQGWLDPLRTSFPGRVEASSTVDGG